MTPGGYLIFLGPCVLLWEADSPHCARLGLRIPSLLACFSHRQPSPGSPVSAGFPTESRGEGRGRGISPSLPPWGRLCQRLPLLLLGTQLCVQLPAGVSWLLGSGNVTSFPLYLQLKWREALTGNRFLALTSFWACI